MMEEENYIVSLINSMGGNATLSSWEDNLNFLSTHYETLSANAENNIEHVDSYIRAYTIVKECENLPEYKLNTTTTLESSYDYENAVSYAYDWWDGHNPNYSNWDGYCQNYLTHGLMGECLDGIGKIMPLDIVSSQKVVLTAIIILGQGIRFLF